MAPHGTPPAVIGRLNDVLARILTEPDVTRQFEQQGVSAGKLSGAELAAFIRSETAKWTKTAKDAGIAPE
jgi:tripartite-type tricarboxylate transporter receptor subunit TctC